MNSETRICNLCKCVNSTSSIYCKRCKRKLDSTTNTKIVAIPDNEIKMANPVSPSALPPKAIPPKTVPPGSVPIKVPAPKSVSSVAKPVKLVGFDTPKRPVSSHTTPTKSTNKFLKNAPSLD